MNPLVSVALFIASAVIGYFLIRAVPSILHTPLMSGMNALSGITVLGALAAIAVTDNAFITVLCCVAVVLAMINVAGGFCLTNRILRMFDKKEDGPRG